MRSGKTPIISKFILTCKYKKVVIISNENFDKYYKLLKNSNKVTYLN